MTRYRFLLFLVLAILFAVSFPDCLFLPGRSSESVTTSASTVTTGGTTQISIGGGQTLYFAEIPAGTFTMGSPDTETYHQSDETQHQVTLGKAFYMGKHEVTQAQYKQLMGTNPSYFIPTQTSYSSGYANTDNQPVEQVSWFDAVRFCNAMSSNQGLTACYTNQSGSTTIAGNDTVTCNWDGPFIMHLLQIALGIVTSQ